MDNNLKPIPPLRPFQRFVIQNFPFIEKDFQDLDSYGLWCKVIEYVNIIKDQVNDVTESQVDVINRFNALNDYVHDYFDNLDVQEEIDNKLDAMVEAGTLQEIITEYIQANVAWTFDTVADMKNATNLVNGSYAQTLGFHSINDGGGAIYKISNTGTANEMDVIAVGSLYAILTNLTEANPLQFGANGDGTSDDTSYLQRCINYAQTNNLVIHFPEKTYLTDDITITDVKIIKIDGTIKLSSSSQSILIQNNVNNGKNLNVYINKVTVGTLLMKGLNSADVTVQYADVMKLLADSTTGHNFIGYSKFYLGYIKTLTLEDDGSSTKWINENLFIGGRFQNVNIGTGSSAYNHQSNLFLEPMCEHTTWSFGKAKGNRVVKARLEGTCVVNFSADAMSNTIEQDYKSDPVGYFLPSFVIHSDITVNDLSLGKNSVVCNKNLTTISHLIGINKFTNPNSQTVDGEVLKPGKNQLLFQSEIVALPSDYFLIYIKTSNPNITFRIRCYDENKQLLATAPTVELLESTSVIARQTVNSYGNGSYNRNDYWGLIKPNNPDIKYIDVRVSTANNTAAETAEYKNIDLYATSYANLESYLIDGLSKMATI